MTTEVLTGSWCVDQQYIDSTNKNNNLSNDRLELIPTRTVKHRGHNYDESGLHVRI